MMKRFFGSIYETFPVRHLCGRHDNKLRTAIALLAFMLHACSAPPDIWGRHATPTAGIVTSGISSGTTPSPALTADPPTATIAGAAQYTPASTPTAPRVSASADAPQSSSDPVTPSPTATSAPMNAPVILYQAHSGDGLYAVAARFGVQASDIHSPTTLPSTGLIQPGSLLVIPRALTGTLSPDQQIMPDSEVVYSRTATEFDYATYIQQSGGYLSRYKQWLGAGWTTGWEQIGTLAYDNSVNPRLMLALLDYESNWVRGQPQGQDEVDYPMGYKRDLALGLHAQARWAINQISNGYYGWRTGSVTTLTFTDGTSLRLDPTLNAGTVAIQFFFSKLYDQPTWHTVMDPATGFPAFYAEMMGDPWLRSVRVDPLFPPTLTQPSLALPFEMGPQWHLTGGPHGAWEEEGSLAAVDFAPATDHGGCDRTPTWVTSAAPGLIVRSDHGVVVEDLDGDGFEQTGWNLVYLHIAAQDRIPAGTFVAANTRLGHASCEGGVASGTHLHFARKYNGEWVAADGPLPMILSDWMVHAGSKPYEGSMSRDGKTVVADPVGTLYSTIYRSASDQ